MRMVRFASPNSAGTLASAALYLLLAPATSPAQVTSAAPSASVYRPPVTVYQPRAYASTGYVRPYAYPARPAAIRRTRPISYSRRNWPTGRDLPLYKPWLQPR